MVSKSIYTQIYNNLVEKGKILKEQWKPTGSGLERHRIVPGHQGGEYIEENCTYLTRREHIIAHFLLWKINGHEGDFSAYQMMKGIKCYPPRLGVKHTEETRRRMSESHKKRYEDPAERAKLSESHKGKKHSEESKRRISESNKGKKRTEESKRRISESKKGKKLGPHTEETRRRMSESHKKRYEDPELRAKLSESHKGKKHSEETKQRMSESRKGKKRTEESKRKQSEAMKKRWAKQKEHK